MISFKVEGIPRPQGSKRHVGGGRMIESSKHVAAWREWVRMRAAEAMAGRAPFTGPVSVEAVFWFVRPKSHFKGTSVRESAPLLPASRPDVDKLLRASLDAMTGIVFVDDSQVCMLLGCKEYHKQSFAEFLIGEK